jgi:tRNA nucleotidyltransferase (CCA-adding enzyme)
MRLAVPQPVMDVCRRLQGAGHEAYTVGGAVRDALLGREPGDWDVTTSALPDQVTELFRRTIPTGIEHGTVTVMIGDTAIEVTTFRGEGAYSDSRRPDEVTFGVPLKEDLARRDFVINAIAYDPIAEALADPFGGEADIERRLVRAVGDPIDRFTEDGLRVMRAVRFVAVLDFELEEGTEAALAPGLSALARVASERVRAELLKLLGGVAAGRALDIAHRRGVLETALPATLELGWPAARERVEACERDPVLRLAALLFGDVDPPIADAALRTLTASNAERKRIVAALGLSKLEAPADHRLRRALGEVGRDVAADLAALWRAAGRTELAGRAAAILSAGDPLVGADLAIKGGDLIAELGLAPGPAIGELMRALLDAVHRDPAANTRERLLAIAAARDQSTA